MKLLVNSVSVIYIIIPILLGMAKAESLKTGKTAEYNNYCNEDEGIYCKQNLTCINSSCKCKITSHILDEKLVYVEESAAFLCLPIATKWDGWGCKYNIQCKESKYGNASRCLTGKYSKTGSCECHDEIGNRPVQLVDGTCAIINLSQLTISSSKNAWTCNYNYQCTNGTFGKYSKCNTTTGSGTGVGTCECFDTDGLKRGIQMVDNICYVRKQLGHTCRNDNECNATITGEAVCLGSFNGNKVGVCKCAPKYQYESFYDECLKLGTIHSACKTDFQCKHLEALGELSKCNGKNKTCECWDVPGLGKMDVKFYEGRCHYSRGVNQTCKDKQECILGYHQNADCMKHDSYNGERVCQCSEGFECTNISNIFVQSIVLVIIGTVVSIFQLLS